MKEIPFSYLEKIFGRDKFIYDSIPDKYSYDESTIYKSNPHAVFLPQSENEVIDFMKIAVEKRLNIIPRGAGTGVCGGAVPIYGGIVISMEKMKKIIDIDEINLCVKVEAGLVNGDLKASLEKENYYYPPDPQSSDTSTLGGNIATNAGGPRAIKYGTTKDYVMGLNVITGKAEKLIVGGRVYKNSSGYNLNELICGSEGTLCIITEAILKIIPAPLGRILLLLPFPRIDDALKFFLYTQKERISFSALEFIDDTAVYYIEKFLNRKMPYSQHSKCYLFAELESKKENEMLDLIESIAEKSGCKEIFVATDKTSEERLWEARKKISYAFKEFSKKVFKADIVVPRSEIANFIKKVKLVSSDNAPIACFGHIGDGNVHVNILDLEGMTEQKANFLMNKIMDIVKNCGGFPSGEHGIGVAKMRYVKSFFSTYNIYLWKKIKRAFDPYGIMNPGKIF